jgi:hypothetical protein
MARAQASRPGQPVSAPENGSPGLADRLQEFIDAYRDLGRQASQVVFVAVNVDHYYLRVAPWNQLQEASPPA